MCRDSVLTLHVWVWYCAYGTDVMLAHLACFCSTNQLPVKRCPWSAGWRFCQTTRQDPTSSSWTTQTKVRPAPIRTQSTQRSLSISLTLSHPSERRVSPAQLSLPLSPFLSLSLSPKHSDLSYPKAGQNGLATSMGRKKKASLTIYRVGRWQLGAESSDEMMSSYTKGQRSSLSLRREQRGWVNSIQSISR